MCLCTLLYSDKTYAYELNKFYVNQLNSLNYPESSCVSAVGKMILNIYRPIQSADNGLTSISKEIGTTEEGAFISDLADFFSNKMSLNNFNVKVNEETFNTRLISYLDDNNVITGSFTNSGLSNGNGVGNHCILIYGYYINSDGKLYLNIADPYYSGYRTYYSDTLYKALAYNELLVISNM